VVAGVIGTSKFIYDLWGDTVNVASRMESHGEAGQVQVTRPVYEALNGEYSFESRGTMEVKGKGAIEAWLLTRRS
jgi:class 3 adenylate cyclase